MARIGSYSHFCPAPHQLAHMSLCYHLRVIARGEGHLFLKLAQGQLLFSQIKSGFTDRSEEPKNQCKSSVFKNVNRSNLGRSPLEGKKDHLLSQANSELMRQEHQVESLKKFISELQQQTYAQRLALQDIQHGYIEFRHEQVRLQEELSTTEKVLRDTQIRNMHEMGEIERAQEPRIDEVSVQKLRENHETIQRLTLQMQEV